MPRPAVVPGLLAALALAGCSGADAPVPPGGAPAAQTPRTAEVPGPGPLTEEGLTEALRTAPPGPPRSNAEVRLACMADQGFPSTVDEWGQEGIPFELGHEDDLARADYVCAAMYPVEEKYLRPFSLHQLRLLYDWRVEQTVPCLRADGVEVPEPPSFETFVGEYAATGYRHWSPRSTVELPPEIETGPGFADWCPDTPPQDVLYGD